jgi:hypothetical protein
MTNDRFPGQVREAAGIFLLSAAYLFFELHALRFFTLSQWHHFGALVVSLALFGGAGAAVALAMSARLRRADPGPAATLCAVATAVTVWAGLHAASWIRFQPVRPSVGLDDLAAVAGWYACFGAPMFFAALGVLYFFLDRRRSVGATYAANLLGGAAGTVAAVVLDHGGAFGTVALACSAALLLSPRRWMWPAVASILLLAALVRPPMPVSEFKALSLLPQTLGARIEFEGRRSGHHVALLRAPVFRHAPGLALTYRGVVPTGQALLIDGDRPDIILEPPVDPELLRSLPGAVGHELAPPGPALLLDAGGNLPVLMAREFGRLPIVQMPPEVAGLWTADADIRIGPPRRLLRTLAPGSIAYAEIVLRDGAATMTSAIGQPAEGYLFTVEAWRDILRLLRPGGLLCVTRWLEVPPRESLRLVATAWKSAPGGVVVFRSLQTITILVRPSGFDSADMKNLADALRRRSYDLVFPGGSGMHAQAIDSMRRDPARFHAAYPFTVEPATDDRPFPWFFLKPGRLAELRDQARIGWQPLLDGGFLLAAAAAQAAVIGLALIALPFLRRKDRPPVKSAVAPGLYFLLIGLGFLMVEIPIAQVLMRSAPSASHAFGAAVTAMLLGAGFGSYRSERRSLRGIAAMLAVTSVAIGFVCLLLPALAGLAWIAVAALAAIPAVGMGMAMPGGLRWALSLGAWGPAWGWAVNGCASVLAPLLASILALGLGFRLVLALAALLYLGAAALLARAQSEDR